MAQNQGVVVVAAVIKLRIGKCFKKRFLKTAQYLVPILLGLSVPLMAAILPPDRADFLYHSYEGGGIQINGPSILVKKALSDHTSLSYNFYIDSITSASVDVLTYGSPYTEKRTENDLSMEYVDENTILSIGVANSTENDYDANTVFLGVNHEMFGALTTVSLGYSAGSDTIRRSDRADFIAYLKRYKYKLDISQIITKSIVFNLGFETVTEEGYTQNPYRNVLYYDPGTDPISNEGRPQQREEDYPDTRTSNAVAFRAMYYVPYRAKLYGELRGFQDSWDITASSWMVGYTQPIGRKLTLDFHYRVYNQTQASFFFDFIKNDDSKEFEGRDKELDAMTSVTSGVSLHYQLLNRPWWIFDKGTLNFAIDNIAFSYENYTDRSSNATFPEQRCRKNATTDCPSYSFSARVFQLYWSLWY